MAEMASLHAVVYGLVQGVFFRAFVARQAERLGLTGYVRNLPSGAVAVEAEGELEKLEKLVQHLKVGPHGARVERVVADHSAYRGAYPDFTIKH